MMGHEPVASEEMIREALGDDADEMMHPPFIEAPEDHELWPTIREALRQVYDPEIPVNLYELGLIYKVKIDEENNVTVEMSLTSPACPVAGEMPGMVQQAIHEAGEFKTISVELVWDEPWNPSRMAETARLALNMY